jgi:hypothetical protein
MSTFLFIPLSTITSFQPISLIFWMDVLAERALGVKLTQSLKVSYHLQYGHTCVAQHYQDFP